MSAGYVVGLTGDVGGGKSTVLEWLGSRGCATFDADKEVHRLLAEDPEVVSAILDRFGETVRCESGIDRAAVAAVVFEDPQALDDLERIVHPAVIRSFRDWVADIDAAVAVVEAVKLVESGMHEAVDEVWLVLCEAAIRRSRLIGRGWPPDEVVRRMLAAGPLAPRLAEADVVIDNSGTRDATIGQLQTAWQSLSMRFRRRDDTEI